MTCLPLPYVSECMYMCTYVTLVCKHVNMCLHIVCMCVCVCVHLLYLYIHTYIHYNVCRSRLHTVSILYAKCSRLQEFVISVYGCCILPQPKRNGLQVDVLVYFCTHVVHIHAYIHTTYYSTYSMCIIILLMPQQCIIVMIATYI